VGTGFRKRSCSNNKLERDDDSKKSHPALCRVESREPLSPPDDQSLNVLAGDVAPEWASFDVTRSVTDSGGPARFYDIFNGTILAGTAMGVFVPEAVSTGMRSRRRQNSTLPTRGSDGTDQKRRSSGYAGPRASIARQPMASTAQEILVQAETMGDAEARQTMREIAARYEKLALRVEQRTRRADVV